MTMFDKYDRLSDKYKTVRISGVLKGITLSTKKMHKWITDQEYYNSFDFMDMPAVDTNNLQQ